jgi:hypothetical protein
VAITEADVEAFLDAAKVIPADANMRWRARNAHNQRCHLPVEADGVGVGEVVMVVNTSLTRHWTFKLLRRRDEVLRWDFRRSPTRHRNPQECGGEFERVVREQEHEHIWREATGNVDCARALHGVSSVAHDQAFMAFCARAKIAPHIAYQPPPLQQLTLE